MSAPSSTPASTPSPSRRPASLSDRTRSGSPDCPGSAVGASRPQECSDRPRTRSALGGVARLARLRPDRHRLASARPGAPGRRHRNDQPPGGSRRGLPGPSLPLSKAPAGPIRPQPGDSAGPFGLEVPKLRAVDVVAPGRDPSVSQLEHAADGCLHPREGEDQPDPDLPCSPQNAGHGSGSEHDRNGKPEAGLLRGGPPRDRGLPPLASRARPSTAISSGPIPARRMQSLVGARREADVPRPPVADGLNIVEVSKMQRSRSRDHSGSRSAWHMPRLVAALVTIVGVTSLACGDEGDESGGSDGSGGNRWDQLHWDRGRWAALQSAPVGDVTGAST